MAPSLIDLPPGRKPIGVKWVFKVNWNEHRAVSKHKACLMVKGYAQWHGIDYNEVFAPVARLDSMRLFIALTTHKGGGIAPHECQISILEQRPIGGGLRRAAGGLRCCRQIAQGAQGAEGTIRASSSVAGMEHEVG
jgi:hypothetical protein